MATAELLQCVAQWLEDLRYPNASSVDLPTFLRGDFGAAVVWLAGHALGRRDVAHVKRQLHMLHSAPPGTVSESQRALLGLARWDDAVRESGHLREEDASSSDRLSTALDGYATNSLATSSSLREIVRRELYLHELEETEATMIRHKKQIELLITLIETWSSNISKCQNISISTYTNAILDRLHTGSLESASSELPNAAPLPATEHSLSELSESLAREKSALEVVIKRHTDIRPPLITIVEDTLTRLKRDCIEVNQSSTTQVAPSLPSIAPSAAANRRVLLINSIKTARKRRLAIEEASRAFQTGPSAISNATEGEAVAGEKNLQIEANHIQDLLQLRLDIQNRLATLSNSLDTQPLLESIAELDARKSGFVAEMKKRERAANERFVASGEEGEGVASSWAEEESLAKEGKRALSTASLLASHTLPTPSLTKSEVDQRCDQLAESRFALEASLPPLKVELERPLPNVEIKEAVRLRQNLTSGKMLPRDLKEELFKLERNLAKERERKGRKEVVSGQDRALTLLEENR